MQSGETVFIPDAATDPSLKHVKGELLNRRVKSITVVPITWRGVAIGAIFLRTFRDGPTFSDRSEEHTSELQSLAYLVCRLLLSEKHTSELQSLAYLVCRLLLEKKKNISTMPQAAFGHHYLIPTHSASPISSTGNVRSRSCLE